MNWPLVSVFSSPESDGQYHPFSSAGRCSGWRNSSRRYPILSPTRPNRWFGILVLTEPKTCTDFTKRSHFPFWRLFVTPWRRLPDDTTPIDLTIDFHFRGFSFSLPFRYWTPTVLTVTVRGTADETTARPKRITKVAPFHPSPPNFGCGGRRPFRLNNSHSRRRAPVELRFSGQVRRRPTFENR